MSNNSNLNPQWIAGFIDGEVCFHVSIVENDTMRTGYEVRLEFSISQHVRDTALMSLFILFFNCGYLAFDGPTKVQFRIRSIKQIEDNLLPFLANNPLLTRKSLDAADFIKVFNLMKAKKHLTMEGIEIIRNIQTNMNSGRPK